MKISICIPQYNRIEVLLKNLHIIEQQDHVNLEVVVSDDCSTDNTEAEIQKLIPIYKFPLVYYRFEKNQGYDRNYRHSIELASGDYCFVIGNDDTVYGPQSISHLALFLQQNDFPDIGYCNFVEGEDSKTLVNRALETRVHGSGMQVALKHVNGFSFVGGIIYKRSTFLQYNTSAYDSSIYSQMYLGLLMIAKGCTLFTINEPMVLKDLQMADGSLSWSPVRNALPTKWKDAKKIKSGLLSVLNVLISACRDAKVPDRGFIYSIMKRMYSTTYPYWIIQYKHYGNYYTALGLMNEMNPIRNNHLRKLGIIPLLKILGFYAMSSAGALLIPFRMFEKIKGCLHLWVRKN